MTAALSPCPSVPLTMPATVGFALHIVDSPERTATEQFVRGAYRNSYGAQLQALMPLLLEVRCHNTTQAALGMRPGRGDAPFYLEHYLDQPVEQVIARRSAGPVARADIVEIGNLAAARRGASPLLFLIMAATLDAAGYRWLAFTATPQVEKLVARLQYRPLELSDVDPDRIGPERALWGTYYETRPRVMCVPLAEALDAGRRNALIDATLVQHRDVIAAFAGTLRRNRRGTADTAA